MNVELSNFGANLRRARRARKISQEAFADLCGLHRTYICDIERGARNVSFISILKVAQGLGMTVSELTLNVESGDRGRLELINSGCAVQLHRLLPNSSAPI
jgi:transcriptional regulator with XRE-family HTH domain